MSELITLTGGATETIHGTYSAAITYIAMGYGSAYDAWAALTPDNRKRTLAAAVRHLNAQSWNEDADTFAERDAIAAFASAQYELAVLIADDPELVKALDAGSNISSMSAGSASISFFAPTKPGAGATKLPPIVHRLVGEYLASSSSRVTSYSSTGSDSNPFSECHDYDRKDPY